MAALQECTTLHRVRETLANFPLRIEDVYIRTWNRILSQTQGQALLVRLCISWVLNAARSLTVDELRHAIAMCPRTCQFDPERLVPVDSLIAACCGLLVVDEKTQLIRLVRELISS